MNEPVVGSVGSIHSSRVLDKAHAPDEFHCEKTSLVVDEQLIKTHQILMSHIGKASELALQTIERGGARLTQGLQRNDLVSDSVVHFIDHSHSARAEPSQHTKAPGVAELLVGEHSWGLICRMLEERMCFLVGHPLAHHVSMKIWIPGAGLIQKRRARGRLLQLDIVEDRPHAPLPVGHVTHRPESSQGLLPRSTQADIRQMDIDSGSCPGG